MLRYKSKLQILSRKYIHALVDGAAIRVASVLADFVTDRGFVKCIFRRLIENN